MILRDSRQTAPWGATSPASRSACGRAGLEKNPERLQANGAKAPGSCCRSHSTPIYTWFSWIQMSPSKLLTSETNTDVRALQEGPQDLYPFHRNGDALTQNWERWRADPLSLYLSKPARLNCCLADTAIHKEQERLVQSPDLMCWSISHLQRSKSWNSQHDTYLLWSLSHSKQILFSSNLLGFYSRELKFTATALGSYRRWKFFFLKYN